MYIYMSGIINIIIISEKKGLYIQHSDNRNDTEKKTIFPKKEQLSTFPQHTHTHTHTDISPDWKLHHGPASQL